MGQRRARNETGWACCRWVNPAPGCDVPLGLVGQRVGQLDQRDGDAARLIAQVEPQVGGHLVVAGAAGAQLAAERAEPLEQAALDRGVHVLVVEVGDEVTGGDQAGQIIECGQDLAELGRVEQARPVAALRACARDRSRS